MSSETEIENWERLAAKYLRRLAAEDMRQWERHWRLESLSSVLTRSRAASATEDNNA
jgi:hypothetical protein